MEGVKRMNDKVIGFFTALIAATILVIEVLWGIVAPLNGWTGYTTTGNMEWIPPAYWAIAIPVVAAVVIVMLLFVWIGYTMIVTPAPKPIENIEFDVEESSEEE